MSQHAVKERKRAPSQRSVAARERILDAAERVFSERGFEGASIRDIAERAQVQKANVNFHGGPKEELFERIVARRASVLSEERLAAIKALEGQDWRIRDFVAAYMLPLITRAFGGDPQWLAYARIVAMVSADTRWRALAKVHFDPAASFAVQALCARFPNADPNRVSASLVYAVSAMLALCTSDWRISALSGSDGGPEAEDMIENLLSFCEAGITGSLSTVSS